MAKIHEEIIVFKLSKLVRETDQPTIIVTDELITNLTSIAGELVPDNIVIEVEQVQ